VHHYSEQGKPESAKVVDFYQTQYGEELYNRATDEKDIERRLIANRIASMHLPVICSPVCYSVNSQT